MQLSRTKIMASLLAVCLAFLPAGCGNMAASLEEGGLPLSCDVVIIGDSSAALTAALEAARQGASVIVIHERRGAEHWLLNAGAVAASAEEETGENAEAGPPPSPADGEVAGLTAGELEQALAERGGNLGKRRHFELLAGHAYADLRWFASETGVTLRELWPGYFNLDNLDPERVYQRLLSTAGREGVRFIAGADVEEIFFSDARAVAGVRFASEDYGRRTAYTRAVILADGGYLYDQELMKEFAPAVEAAPWRSGGEAGGLRLAIGIGLDMVQLDRFAYYPALRENGRWVKAYLPQGALLILEERIEPLHGKSTEDLLALLLMSNRRSGYLLVEAPPLGRGEREEREQLNWRSFTGIDAFLDAYELELPLLRNWFARPESDFKGAELKVVAEYCLGGIAVDDEGRTLIGGEPLPGLYAAGEIAGGLHGRAILPGAVLSEAVVWGRMVGRAAAAFAQQ